MAAGEGQESQGGDRGGDGGAKKQIAARALLTESQEAALGALVGAQADEDEEEDKVGVGPLKPHKKGRYKIGLTSMIPPTRLERTSPR